MYFFSKSFLSFKALNLLLTTVSGKEASLAICFGSKLLILNKASSILKSLTRSLKPDFNLSDEDLAFSFNHNKPQKQLANALKTRSSKKAKTSETT